MIVLNLWQIDSFEGGRGSRANYIQSIAETFREDCYITVTSISAEAARENLKKGTVPDMISYGAGIYGIESFVRQYDCWANGGYCLLTLEEESDFSDVTVENTIINGGIDNLVGAAAVLCGLHKASTDRPTGAYVKLIQGKFKYLLGTQRDIFRLKSRGVAFSVKPITEYNDLYQNISITATETERVKISDLFVKYLLSASEKVSQIGLMHNGTKLYDNELSVLEGITYENSLRIPVSESFYKQLNSAISAGDRNLIKNLLN